MGKWSGRADSDSRGDKSASSVERAGESGAEIKIAVAPPCATATPQVGQHNETTLQEGIGLRPRLRVGHPFALLVVSTFPPLKLEKGNSLIVMPLGHNRRDPEFGKIVPLGRSSEGPEGTAGLGPAILLSLGLHALIGLMFWHSLVGRGHENPAVTRIIDTRVRNPGMEVEACLRLFDSPKPGLKKASTQP